MHRCILNNDNTNNEIANDTGGEDSNEENCDLEWEKQANSIISNVNVLLCRRGCTIAWQFLHALNVWWEGKCLTEVIYPAFLRYFNIKVKRKNSFCMLRHLHLFRSKTSLFIAILMELRLLLKSFSLNH